MVYKSESPNKNPEAKVIMTDGNDQAEVKGTSHCCCVKGGGKQCIVFIVVLVLVFLALRGVNVV